MNSKRIIAILCATAFLGVIGLLVSSSHSAPANKAVGECEGCQPTKIRIDLTGDPDGDRAAVARAKDIAKGMQQALDANAIREHLADFAKWHGTRLSVKDVVADRDTIALHQAICDIFSAADPAAPVARSGTFQKWLAAGAKNRCAGYYGTVESVTPNENGWMAIIKVSPKLMSKNAAVVFTPCACDEEWQIGKDGSLQNLSSQVDPKTNRMVFTD